jgi:alkanesulfonate monooxygenase SsuD/methylene tetrahydromethanopterin reductase-like flavin-dependent oxidoreductase (luciferase family)
MTFAGACESCPFDPESETSIIRARLPRTPMVYSLEDSGIMLEPQLGMSMDQLVQTAKAAEDLGFGYLMRSDHLLPTNDRRGMDSPECWTSLGAIAASTSRIRFGPLVTPIGFRNPALLAKMATTLHSFSRGRLRLAVGAGWYEAEYKANGYPFPDFRGRVSEFKEALQIVSSLLESGRVDFDGSHFSAHTDCLPRPDGHMHFIIGGRTKPVVRLAGKYADEWNFFHLTRAQVDALGEVLAGSSPGRRVELTEMTPYMVARTQEELEADAKRQATKLGQDVSPSELLARLRARDAPCGTVDDFVDQLRAKADAGVQRIYFQTLVPENTAMTELLADTLGSGV